MKYSLELHQTAVIQLSQRSIQLWNSLSDDEGVKQYLAKASELYQQAAVQGYTDAQT